MGITFKKKLNTKKVIHMAGIVPVAGQPLDFNMPWNDAFIPIGPDYLAIERAVYECALAGCETIWVVARVGTEPLLKKRLGEFITDPMSLKKFTIYKDSVKRNISIFYVPIRPRDQKTKDSFAWSILYGADCAFRLSANISKWVLPQKFYCAFPFGVTSDEAILKKRLLLAENKKTVISYKGQTVKDGLHMSFTFDEDDYKRCRNIMKNMQVNTWSFETKDKARDYTFQEVFSGLDFTDADVLELPWYYDISSWKNYCSFVGSEHSQDLKKNTWCFVKNKRRMFAKFLEIKYTKQANDALIAEDPDKELALEQKEREAYEQENGEILQQSTEQDQTKNESS